MTPGRRAGFGLLGVVVMLLAVSLVTALAITPNLAQVDGQWRVDRSLDRLGMLTDSDISIVRFVEDVGEYPGALSHLSRVIANTDQDICGNNYGGGAGGWGGRYAGRIYPVSGTPLPVGLLLDDLDYDPAGPAMVLVVTGVREEQARQMDLRTDGAMDGAAGRVRYSAADATGLVELYWRTTIPAC